MLCPPELERRAMTELSPKAVEAAMVATGALVTIAWVTFLYLVGVGVLGF
jgi:hypothetical protein